MIQTVRPHQLLVLALLCSAACGEPAKPDAKKTEVTKADAKVEAKAAPEVKAPEVKAPEAAPAAPVDPATFEPVDLASVAVLAKYTVKGPPGAKVTPDAPGFGDDAPGGAVIEKDGFKLHLWSSTIGAERTVMPMRAQQDSSKYTETKNEGEKGLLEYTFEKDGKTTHGYIQAKFSTLKGSILCGNQDGVADPAALEAYRKACETLAEKK